ncbi:alginate export family protein [Rhodocytophaga aerolata]
MEFKSIRWEEDYSYLKSDSARVPGFFDAIKFIPLSRHKKNYLSIGGELRYQYEYIRHIDWGEAPDDKDGYLLQRYMLHTDWHFGKLFRIFGQLKSGIVQGKTGELDLPDKDVLDVHQAFAELTLPYQKSQIILRIGRQEMNYGSSRLVTVREGPNVRLSFDAGKLIYKTHAFQADAFVSRPAETKTGVFDNGSDQNVLFWGVYTTRDFPSILQSHVDLYYLGLEDKRARFEQGEARELRHSTGVRLWSKETRLNYNLEGVYQLGRYGIGEIRAWTSSAELSYELAQLPLAPTLKVNTEIISGDRSKGNPDLQTFNPLFPKGAYFGQVALIGPANLIDVHPSITLRPVKNLELITDWDFFWRESVHDGLYGVPYVLIRESSGSKAAYIGNQLSVEAEWQFNRHLQIEGFYTFFRTGDFLKQTGVSKNLTYLSARMSVKF